MFTASLELLQVLGWDASPYINADPWVVPRMAAVNSFCEAQLRTSEPNTTPPTPRTIGLTRHTSFRTPLTDLIGPLVYALSWPERRHPGTYDLFGGSHQLMHISVLAAAICLGLNLDSILRIAPSTTCAAIG